MRLHLMIVASLVGAGLLLDIYGLEAILALVGSFGWGYAILAIVHLVPMMFSALGWRAVMLDPVCLWFCFKTRSVREGVNNLLPVAQIGGEVVGVRLLAFDRAKMANAIASAVADLTVEATTQVVFTLIGLALLVGVLGITPQALTGMIIGTIVSIIAVTGFIIAQKWGLMRLLEKFSRWLGSTYSWLKIQGVDGCDDALKMIYHRPSAWIMSSIWHLMAWIVGSSEVWLVFWWLGLPISWIDAIIIESLIQAVRSAAFFVPAAIGVQEGAYIIVGSFLGIGPETALSVSLIRRIRHVIVGIPALLYWQYIEIRRKIL